MEAKSNQGTILNVRVSYKAKQALMKKAEQLMTTEFSGSKVTVSDLVKVALKDVWGVDCDTY